MSVATADSSSESTAIGSGPSRSRRRHGSRRMLVRSRRRTDQGEDCGSAGKRNRVIADRIPLHVSPVRTSWVESSARRFSDRYGQRSSTSAGRGIRFSFKVAVQSPCSQRRRYGRWFPTWRSRSSARPNSAVEVQTKIDEYFEAGVSGVWVIYPKQKKIHIYASPTQIQVVQLGDELDGGDLLPGFRLPLSALFEDDPE